MEKRKVAMHVEGVPNPHAMKFVLENGVLTDQPYEYTDWRSAESAPLARKLLLLRYVERVMLNANYITVVKDPSPDTDWGSVLAELRMIIQQHLEDDEPILYLGAESIGHERSEDAVVAIIRDILEKQVRPAAQEDGGDIVFDSYADGVLNLSMHGACHGCPYVRTTLKDGVEKLMNHFVPEVKRVVATGNSVQS
jgi:NFU1 iron-sulfur cluster scaffold homolog, mitochondrial